MGWAFMVMRTRYDPGAHRALDKLKQIPNRRPWQISTRVSFPPLATGVGLQEVTEIKDNQGLFTCTLTMAPSSQTTMPDPANGDGQYVVVVRGSFLHDNKEREAPVVVFIKPDEKAFHIQAGEHGLEAIIMNFPTTIPRADDTKVPSATAGFKRWKCELCSFGYDEALGMPEDGIPPGTRWADVPDLWRCPDCSARKSDFKMVEI
jgi:rubredoxin